MPIEQTVTVDCPQCQAKGQYCLHESFNTQVDPEGAQKALTGEAFAFVCQKCGAKTYVNHGFLFNDPALQLMVRYVACEDEIEPAVKMFNDIRHAEPNEDNPAKQLMANLMSQFTLRIVTQHEEVTEKVAIAKAGYDDRVMELTKLILGSKIAVEEKFDFDGVLYLPAQGEQEERIEFSDSKTSRALTVPFENVRELYRSLSSQFGDRLQNEYNEDVVINAAWALGLLKKENELG